MGTYTRWEVFCSKSKMQFLVLLLSATLATVAYGAANPGGHHFGHAYHDGPHCHDQKDHQCHKTPKQQEHEECFVDYDIIVDVTYIEECEYVVITHCSEEHEQVYHNSHIVKGESAVVDAHHEDYAGDYHKRSANPGDHGYSSGPYCEDKKEKQCHKHPKENTRKIPKQTSRRLWTQSILKSVRRESTLFVRSHMREVTTALVLLIITQRLWLLLITLDIMRVMEVITRKLFLYSC